MIFKLLCKLILFVAGILMLGLTPNIWMKNGNLVVNSSDQPIDCPTCPCGCQLVQHTFNVVNSGPATATWPVATTAGNLLIAVVGVIPDVTITGQGIWNTAGGGDNVGNCSVSILYITNAASRSGAETFTLSGTATAWVELLEYSNPGGGVFDVSAGGTGNSVSPDTGATVGMAAPNEIQVGAIVYINGTSAFTAPSGGTFVDQILDTGSYYGVVLQQLTNALGATAGMSCTGNPAANWAAAVATFTCGDIQETCGSCNLVPYQWTLTSANGFANDECSGCTLLNNQTWNLTWYLQTDPPCLVGANCTWASQVFDLHICKVTEWGGCSQPPAGDILYGQWFLTQDAGAGGWYLLLLVGTGLYTCAGTGFVTLSCRTISGGVLIFQTAVKPNANFTCIGTNTFSSGNFINSDIAPVPLCLFSGGLTLTPTL